MSIRARNLCLLMAVQMVCVAVGLCIHGRYVLSFTRSHAEQSARETLARSASELLDALCRETPSMPRLGSRDYEQVRTIIRAARTSPQDRVMIVDRDHQVRFEEPASDAQTAGQGPTSHVVSWTTLPGAVPVAEHASWVHLDPPNGRHIGLACPLKNGQGYLLIHRDVETIPVTLAEVERSTWTASGITFIWMSALLAVAVYILVTKFYDAMARRSARSEEESLKRLRDLLHTRDAVAFGLAKLADSRDPQTGTHLERITSYASVFASVLRRHPKYRDVVTPAFVQLIEISTALHDIGKVALEDTVLRKSGPLTNAERIRMQDHTIIGGRCLKQIEQRLGASNFLHMAREIALHHHERWDGKGYPAGLAGETIPLAARIVAIVDVYEALSSERHYKSPSTHRQCVTEICREKGKAFDPDLVDVFCEIAPRFREIARRYVTTPPTESELPSSADAGMDPADHEDGELVLASGADNDD